MIRVLVTKVGLDGHDRGLKVVSTFLREAGMEVIYLGRFQMLPAIVKVAIEEDVDVVGVSCLSGEHLTLVPQLVNELRKSEAKEVPVVVGGIIPLEDASILKEKGVAGVFPTGSPMDQIINAIHQLGAKSKEA